jgi:amphiphysin
VDKIIAESKNFRDSWTRILTHQLETTRQWTQIYAPIAGQSSAGGSTSSPSGTSTVKTYYETPQTTIQSIDSYSAVLEEVKGTLLPILNGLDGKVVQPSIDMKKALESVQKMVKKRHHKKMDYDRFTASVCVPDPGLHLMRVYEWMMLLVAYAGTG